MKSRDEMKCGRSVGVLGASGDNFWLGFRAMRMMGLREGSIANAMCGGISPLSLEHEGRSSIIYYACSFGIEAGRTIFDSPAGGRGEIVRGKC